MAVDMLTWNGKSLKVSPSVVNMFEKLSISSSVKTKAVDKDGVHTVEADGTEAAKYTFTIKLNRQLGVDVYAEVNEWMTLMRENKKSHLLIAGRDLFGTNFMLTSCQTSNVRIAPGGQWSYAELSLTFQESYYEAAGTSSGGGSSGGGGSGSSSSGKKKDKSEASKITGDPVADGVDAISSAAVSLSYVKATVSAVKSAISAAKSASTSASAKKTGGSVSMTK